jgi:hypothetical protein
MLTCHGCGRRLRMEHTDEWCHSCLEHLRTKLAETLTRREWGTAFGPSLVTVFGRGRPRGVHQGGLPA